MATFTVRPEGIIRQPALTMPGNATGSEAACTALNASSIRTLLSLSTVSDVTFDIVRATTSVQTPLVNNASAALTLGNSTYGVTVPGSINMTGSNAYITSGGEIIAGTDAAGFYFGGGLAAVNRHINVGNLGSATNTRILNNATLIGTTTHDGTSKLQVAGAATFTGDISMSKTSAQGYIYAYSPNGAYNTKFYTGNDTYTYLLNNGGPIALIPHTGRVEITNNSGVNSTLLVYNSAVNKYTQLTHDNTNGILSTSSGNLNLVPAGGTVAVTGAVTASGGATITGGGVTSTAGLKIGSLQAGVGGIWDSAVTPSSTNYAFITNTSSTIVNASSAIYLRIGGVTDVATVSTTNGIVSTILKSTNYAICNYGGSPVLWSAAMANSDATYYRTLLNRGNVGTIVTASGGIYGWCSVTDLTGIDTNDTGLARNAAGVVEINNGTLVSGGGSYGGLKCAGITASGNVSYAQGLSTGTVTKSANYTTTADDYCVNVTANSIDITFETAVGCANREHEVINSGSGVVTLKTTSAQTISGSASGALTLAQWKSIRVKSDGSNWLIMSQIT